MILFIIIASPTPLFVLDASVYMCSLTEILAKEQSGFQHTRSTIDNLIIIKTEIENAFKHNQLLRMVCLDISKAYDSVWRHRLIIILS